MEKGLLIVFTGDGKGKTTAALGMALRAAGHGMRTLVLQFIKGAWAYGELQSIAGIPEIDIRPLGSGFTWNKANLDEDRALAREGWELAAEEIRRADYDIIILDELNYVLAYGLIPVEQVTGALAERPGRIHVVVTGRGAPEQLTNMADLVTEMKLVKHPYREQGVKAQKGVEF